MADKQNGTGSWWVSVTMGIMAVVFGLLLLLNPKATSVWVTFIVGVWWMAGGVVNIASLMIDRTQWGWRLFSGILGLLAGVLVIEAVANQPLLAALGLASIWVIIVAVQGILIGVLELMKAFRGGGLSSALIGLLSVLFGILLLNNPLGAAVSLPFVFGFLAIAMGGAAIGTGFRLRKAA